MNKYENLRTGFSSYFLSFADNGETCIELIHAKSIYNLLIYKSLAITFNHLNCLFGAVPGTLATM